MRPNEFDQFPTLHKPSTAGKCERGRFIEGEGETILKEGEECKEGTLLDSFAYSLSVNTITGHNMG